MKLNMITDFYRNGNVLIPFFYIFIVKNNITNVNVFVLLKIIIYFFKKIENKLCNLDITYY